MGFFGGVWIVDEVKTLIDARDEGFFQELDGFVRIFMEVVHMVVVVGGEGCGGER